jgi:hypothetical protein
MDGAATSIESGGRERKSGRAHDRKPSATTRASGLHAQSLSLPRENGVRKAMTIRKKLVVREPNAFIVPHLLWRQEVHPA